MSAHKSRVAENRHSLKELQRQHENTPLENRIRMLLLMRENNVRTIPQVAAMLDCSERNVQRWWRTYTESGIEALLKTGRRGKPRKIAENDLEEIRQRVAGGGFTELKEIRRWIEEQYGVRYSQSGAWYLLRSKLNASRGWITLDDLGTPQTERVSRVSGLEVGLTERIITFLNALPTTDDTIEWITSFRESLRSWFADIDRISININVTCDLRKPEEYRPAERLIQAFSEARGDIDEPTITPVKQDDSPSTKILETYRQQGQPLHLYHEPRTFDYFFAGTAYLGSMILWRDVTQLPTSDATIETIAQLEPFLLFALSDIVARQQNARPVNLVFIEALDQLVAEAKLSPTERRILTLNLMGHSYKEIAEMVAVSIDTVKKHFHQIYKKTGTRGLAELFSKYFSIRLRMEGSAED